MTKHQTPGLGTCVHTAYVDTFMCMCVWLGFSRDQCGLRRLFLFSWFEMLCKPLVVKLGFKLSLHKLHHIHVKSRGRKSGPVSYRKHAVNLRDGLVRVLLETYSHFSFSVEVSHQPALNPKLSRTDFQTCFLFT